jgi:hypothetical protein
VLHVDCGCILCLPLADAEATDAAVSAEVSRRVTANRRFHAAAALAAELRVPLVAPAHLRDVAATGGAFGVVGGILLCVRMLKV